MNVADAGTVFSETVRGRLHDGVLVVTIDSPPVNATSASVRAGLLAAVEAANADAGIAALVLTGAGKIFIGGADIREFGQPAVDPILPDVISAIENSGKVVVAAINGAALGGGLEVALGAHARIAAPSASLGLPEVKLGLVPGAGGTQRLPRLIGADKALDMITSGRALKAQDALSVGLVDRIAAGTLLDEAIAFARSLTGAPPRRTGRLPVPVTDRAAFERARDAVLAKARGATAPREAARLVELSIDHLLEAGLAEERATFLKLRDSEEAAALRHLFFAERNAGKVEGLEATPLPLTTIGIAGLGLMGSGIAAACLSAGYGVVGYETSDAAAEAGHARVAAIIEKAVSLGKLSRAAADEQIARLTASSDLAALKAADMVIEAVFDDFDVKSDLFRKLDAILPEGTLLATNTSYLDPDKLAVVTQRPDRILGLHFFSPANLMRLLEVVRCGKTSDVTLATGLAFARKIGKLPVVTGVCEGFIGNRIFSAYRAEAERLLAEGAYPQEIDEALEAYGFAMGLFAVNDMTGLEIAWARRKRAAATRDPAAFYFDVADKLCEAGRFGRKAGRGWYDYASGVRQLAPEVNAFIDDFRLRNGIASRSFTRDEIVGRLVSAMAREGQAILAEGVAQSADDIDLVLVNGYGFPSARGGPMFAVGRSTRN